jgi:hypothetical protein
VLVVGAVLGGAAGGEGAFLVEDGGEVAQELAGVVPGGLVLVVAWAFELLEVEDELAVGDGQLPGAVASWRPGVGQGQAGLLRCLLSWRARAGCLLAGVLRAVAPARSA